MRDINEGRIEKYIETQRGKKLKHGFFSNLDKFTLTTLIVAEAVWLVLNLLMIFVVGLNSLFLLIAILVIWAFSAMAILFVLTMRNKDMEMYNTEVLWLKIKKSYQQQVFRNENHKEVEVVQFMGADKVKEVFKKEKRYKEVRNSRLKDSVKY